MFLSTLRIWFESMFDKLYCFNKVLTFSFFKHYISVIVNFLHQFSFFELSHEDEITAEYQIIHLERKYGA